MHFDDRGPHDPPPTEAMRDQGIGRVVRPSWRRGRQRSSLHGIRPCATLRENHGADACLNWLGSLSLRQDLTQQQAGLLWLLRSTESCVFVVGAVLPAECRLRQARRLIATIVDPLNSIGSLQLCR